MPLSKLERHLTKLPANITVKQMDSLESKLVALGSRMGPAAMPKGPLPSGAKFCALCGTAVQEGDTVRADVPPHETTPAPPVVQQAAPRWFGLAPPTVLLGLAVVLFVAAVVLIALANWVVGLLLHND